MAYIDNDICGIFDSDHARSHNGGVRLGEECWRRRQARSRRVLPLPGILDVLRELDKILVEAEGEAAAYLVALFLARQAGHGLVVGSGRRNNESGKILEPGGSEDVGLDARVGRLCGGGG